MDQQIEEQSKQRTKRGYSIMKLLIGLLTTLWVAFLGQVLFQYYTSTQNIEYKIVSTEIINYLPQNLSEVGKVLIDGTEVTHGEVTTISFWNRTASDIADLEIRVESEKLSSIPIHKVILYGNSLTQDWVEWTNPKDLESLGFKVAILEQNWSDTQNLSIRLFFAGKSGGKFTFKSKKPGVSFSEFDKEKIYWWLFGFDQAIEITFALLVFIFLTYGLIKLQKWYDNRRYDGCLRLAAKAVEKNFPEFDAKTSRSICWICLKIIMTGDSRFLWLPKHDPSMEIPDTLHADLEQDD